MGFLRFLFNHKQVETPATPPVSSVSPQENYPLGERTTLYNFTGGYIPDPYRLHAPFPLERGDDSINTHTGKEILANNPSVVKIADSPLQQYYNQRHLLPTQDVGVPAHGLRIAPIERDGTEHSIYSGYVPDLTRAAFIPSRAPIILRSTPLSVITTQRAGTSHAISGVTSKEKIIDGKFRKIPRSIK